MSDKLKACPFCGATELPTIDMSIFNQEQGGCYHCEVLIDTDAWNTRPLEDAANARAEAAEAAVARLTAELQRAIDIYKDPAVTHANILNGRIVLPKFYVNITDDFGPVADLRAALDAANEDAERLDKLIMDAICRQTSEIDTEAGLDAHRAHNARVGGAA